MAVAAVTERRGGLAAAAVATALLWAQAAQLFAAVLPEERADMLYHRYDGGGLTVDGPSVLIRKNFADKVSVSANYYIDNVSSASIDVVTQASPYEERRTEKAVSLDYLIDRTMITTGYIVSDESDYHAKTWHLGISQDFFGDLSTFSMGYSRGSDEILANTDPEFKDEATHQQLRLGLSQIVTRNLLLGVNWELVTDQGYLQSPYRSVRYLSGAGTGSQPERYPRSRTSNTATLQARYHLPYRAVVYGKYRYYTDGWEIDADTYEIGYTHTLGNWILDIHYRTYSQTGAKFYSDLFPYQDAQNYLARDRQLSDFDSDTIGIGITYEIKFSNNAWVDKSSINLYWDRIQFDYADFRDLTVTGMAPGTEPLYSFDADVVRFYLTVWY